MQVQGRNAGVSPLRFAPVEMTDLYMDLGMFGMGRTFTLRDRVVIEAPVELCFRLSTSIEVVALTLEMRPVEGKLGGMIGAGDQLVWRGWKFGLPQMHETLITGYREPGGGEPGFFQDTMGRGRFAAFQHDHCFTETGGGTLLEDELRFSMPLGWAGEMVGRVVMVPHIRGLLRRRFALLKRLAEGDGWREYLDGGEKAVRAERECPP